jgi:hypothetical protein
MNFIEINRFLNSGTELMAFMNFSASPKPEGSASYYLTALISSSSGQILISDKRFS